MIEGWGDGGSQARASFEIVAGANMNKWKCNGGKKVHISVIISAAVIFKGAVIHHFDPIQQFYVSHLNNLMALKSGNKL